MQGDSTIIGHLNEALRNELTAINQYFLHAKMFADWGLSKLAEIERQESIDEMNHAEQLIDRILRLEGLPNLQDLGKVTIGENVREALECDLRLEHAAIPALRAAVGAAERAEDFVSRDLFNAILTSEEDHVDWLEAQLQMIDDMGLGIYLSQQLITGADPAAAG